MEAILDIADNWLKLKRVELSVFTDNEPAIALYKKMGFVVEGTKKYSAVRRGAMNTSIRA
jgi:putative acetyltransferase